MSRLNEVERDSVKREINSQRQGRGKRSNTIQATRRSLKSGPALTGSKPNLGGGRKGR